MKRLLPSLSPVPSTGGSHLPPSSLCVDTQKWLSPISQVTPKPDKMAVKVNHHTSCSRGIRLCQVQQGVTGSRRGQTGERAVVFITCEEARSRSPWLVCLCFIYVLVCICFMSLNKSHVSQASFRLPVQAKGIWPFWPSYLHPLVLRLRCLPSHLNCFLSLLIPFLNKEHLVSVFGKRYHQVEC